MNNEQYHRQRIAEAQSPQDLMERIAAYELCMGKTYAKAITTWNFIDPNGNEHVLEKDTANEADEWAQEWFAEQCEATRNGQQFTDIGWLVELNEDGDVVRKIEHGLYYQHWHGDGKEHRTW